MGKKLADVIDLAIKREEEAFDFYMDIVKTVEDANVKDTLEFIAGEEKKHKTRHKVTREMLIELLEDCGWNKAEVGRRLDLSRTAIWKYMKKWDIPLKKDELK